MYDSEATLTEAAFLRFFDAYPLALVYVDGAGRVRLMNAAATTLLRPFAESGHVENLFDLVATADPELVAPLRRDDDPGVGAVWGRRVRLVPHGSGAEAVWLELSVGPFEDGYSIACRDVTAQVASEERFLALASDEARQRGRIEMAAGILHDLGNALTGIAGRAADLRGRVADDGLVRVVGQVSGMLEKHAEGLERLLGEGKGPALLDLLRAVVATMERSYADNVRAVDRLFDFVDHAQELLGVQRTYASGGGAVGRDAQDLHRIMQDVKSMMSASVDRRGGTIAIDCERRLPPLVLERSRFMQVLLNLVRNSAESFDEAGHGGAVSIILEARRAPDGGLLVDVRDSGPGFRPELAETFFEANASTKARGSGIGLVTCRRIVESLGGRISLRSNGPGTGAVAHVELPPQVFADAEP